MVTVFVEGKRRQMSMPSGDELSPILTLQAIEAELQARLQTPDLLVSKPWNAEITPETVTRYARGISDRNPRWFRAAEAGPMEPRMDAAPPSFLLSVAYPSPRLLLDGHALVTRIVEVDMEWIDRLPAAQPLQGRTTIAEASVAGSGERPSLLLRTQTSYHGGGRPLARASVTTLNSLQDEAVPRAAERSGTRDAASGDPGRSGIRTAADAETLACGDLLFASRRGPLTAEHLRRWAEAIGPVAHVRPTLEIYAGQGTGDATHGRTGTARQGQAEAGAEATYDNGTMRFAYVSSLLTDWMGEEGTLRRLRVLMEAPNHCGDVTVYTGKVVETRSFGDAVDVEVRIHGVNQHGTVTSTAYGLVTIRLASDSGAARVSRRTSAASETKPGLACPPEDLSTAYLAEASSAGADGPLAHPPGSRASYDWAAGNKVADSFGGRTNENAGPPTEGDLRRADSSAASDRFGAPSGDPLDGFLRAAKLTPHALAVVSSAAVRTYRELDQASAIMAQTLRAAGYRQGDVIGLLAPRTTNGVVALLSILRAGAAYLVLDPEYPAARLAAMAAFCHVVLCDQSTMEQGRLLHPACLCLDEDRLLAKRNLSWNSLPAPPPVPEAPPVNALYANAVPPVAEDGMDREALAYLMFTSGSTGTPRAAEITRSALAAALRDMQVLGYRANDVCLHTASFSFSASVRQLFAPLSVGATVVLATAKEARDPDSRFALMWQHGVTVWDTTPSTLAQTTAFLQARDFYDLGASRLRLVLLTGEPLHQSTIDPLRGLLLSAAGVRGRGATAGSRSSRQSWPPNQPWSPKQTWLLKESRRVEWIHLYSQTETTGSICAYRLPEDTPAGSTLVPVGLPLPGIRVVVLDAELREVAPGETGAIYVQSARLARGYRGDGEASAERFVDNLASLNGRWLKTGDVGYFEAGGRLVVTGRQDAIVNVRGVRVALAEVEELLASHFAVEEAAVCAVQEESGTTSLAAFITTARGFEAGPHLRTELYRLLPTHMQPGQLTALDFFPRLPNSKLDREALRRLCKAKPVANEGQGASAGSPAPVASPPGLTPTMQVVRRRVRATPVPTPRMLEEARPAEGESSSELVASELSRGQAEDSAGLVSGAPVNELERQILALLGEQAGGSIAVDEPIVNSGIDSLGVVRLAAAIERRFERRLTLTSIYEASTVRALARTMRGVGGQAADSQKNLSQENAASVALKNAGPGTPLFYIPGFNGHPYDFLRVATLMSERRKIYGMQYPRQPMATMEEIGSYFARHIRILQPAGPYLLAGHSLGGRVAFEVAKQLKGSGQRVAGLFMVDASAPVVHRSGRMLKVMRRGAHYYLRLRQAYVDRKVGDLVRRKLWISLGQPPSQRYVASASLSQLLATGKADARYRPRPYDGMVTLFKVQTAAPLDRARTERNRQKTGEREVGQGWLGRGAFYGWERLAREVEVIAIVGDHISCIREEEHARVLAQRLDAALLARENTLALTGLAERQQGSYQAAEGQVGEFSSARS